MYRTKWPQQIVIRGQNGLIIFTMEDKSDNIQSGDKYELTRD